jgi:hypothetical protein
MVGREAVDARRRIGSSLGKEAKMSVKVLIEATKSMLDCLHNLQNDAGDVRVAAWVISDAAEAQGCAVDVGESWTACLQEW